MGVTCHGALCAVWQAMAIRTPPVAPRCRRCLQVALPLHWVRLTPFASTGTVVPLFRQVRYHLSGGGFVAACCCNHIRTSSGCQGSRYEQQSAATSAARVAACARTLRHNDLLPTLAALFIKSEPEHSAAYEGAKIGHHQRFGGTLNSVVPCNPQHYDEWTGSCHTWQLKRRSLSTSDLFPSTATPCTPARASAAAARHMT